MEEIGVGALATSTDAPAQLVQLSETEAFRAVHYQRIDRGQVDARLDDRRAHEHVEATLPEVDHHPFERALVHLSVRDGDARVGHELSESSRHLIDVRDPVVDEEDLTFAQELSSHRLDHRRLVVLAHVREDGPAVGRRRRDHRKVADADEGHLEGSRDRAGAQGQDVHADRTGLDRLLVRHAEALLLVHDEESEVLEADVLRQQSVRADDDVDAAVFQAGQRLFGLGVVDEATEHRHPDRKTGEAIAKRGEVLAREQRRRYQNRRLLTVLDRFEDGANGDFGLAETNVSADQPVHRTRQFHVGLHVLDRLGLVGGQREGEEVLHLALPFGVGAEGVSDGDVALAIQVHQLLGD